MTLHRLLTKVPIAELERRMSIYTATIDQEDGGDGEHADHTRRSFTRSVDRRQDPLWGHPTWGSDSPREFGSSSESGTALAQEAVASKIDERKAAYHLLAPTRLPQSVTTTDALYTQVEASGTDSGWRRALPDGR